MWKIIYLSGFLIPVLLYSKTGKIAKTRFAELGMGTPMFFSVLGARYSGEQRQCGSHLRGAYSPDKKDFIISYNNGGGVFQRDLTVKENSTTW